MDKYNTFVIGWVAGIFVSHLIDSAFSGNWGWTCFHLALLTFVLVTA